MQLGRFDIEDLFSAGRCSAARGLGDEGNGSGLAQEGVPAILDKDILGAERPLAPTPEPPAATAAGKRSDFRGDSGYCFRSHLL